MELLDKHTRLVKNKPQTPESAENRISSMESINSNIKRSCIHSGYLLKLSVLSTFTCSICHEKYELPFLLWLAYFHLIIDM